LKRQNVKLKQLFHLDKEPSSGSMTTAREHLIHGMRISVGFAKLDVKGGSTKVTIIVAH